MRKTLGFLLFIITLNPSHASDLKTVFENFKHIYSQQLGTVSDCSEDALFRVCAKVLRNKGNAPFIKHHGTKTQKVAVLLHGLSDSPYYLKAIAEHLHSLGLNVIVALLPGHGLHSPNDIILHPDLSDFWTTHVSEVLELAPHLGDDVFIGGFSAGGTLATHYALNNTDKVDGIMLFSAALALADNAESLSKIWGVRWIAKWLDTDYDADSTNPYKYSSVPNTAGLELMEVINHIRSQFEGGRRITQPVFVVHSEADITTPIEGVVDLLSYSTGENTILFIDKEHDVCHADVVLNSIYANMIGMKKDSVNPLKSCGVPKHNPLFRQTTNLLSLYISNL